MPVSSTAPDNTSRYEVLLTGIKKAAYQPLLSHKLFRHLVQVVTIQVFDITYCYPRHEIVIFSRTRCKYIPVRSDAASLRHTVLEKMTISCLSFICGTAVAYQRLFRSALRQDQSIQIRLAIRPVFLCRR